MDILQLPLLYAIALVGLVASILTEGIKDLVNSCYPGWLSQKKLVPELVSRGIVVTLSTIIAAMIPIWLIELLQVQVPDDLSAMRFFVGKLVIGFFAGVLSGWIYSIVHAVIKAKVTIQPPVD